MSTFAIFPWPDPGLERGIISERVKAGMDRAKKQGKALGRPRAVNGEWAGMKPLIENGTMSQRRAAQVLGVSRTTVRRELARKGGQNHAPQTRIQ